MNEINLIAAVLTSQTPRAKRADLCRSDSIGTYAQKKAVQRVSCFGLVLAQIFAVPSLATLSHNLAINLLTCFVILSACAWVAYRGMTMTQAVQYVLVGTQPIMLIFRGQTIWECSAVDV